MVFGIDALTGPLAAGLLGLILLWYAKSEGGSGNKTLSTVGGILAVLGFAIYLNIPSQLGFGPGSITGQPNLPIAVAPNTAASAPGTAGSTSLSTCPTNLQTNVQCRARDMKSKTNLYLSGNCYYLDGGGIFNITSATGGTGYGSAVTLDCGKTYKPFWLTVRGGQNGAIGDPFTTSTATNFVTFDSGNASTIQVRVKDITTDAFLNTSADTGAFADLPRAFLNSSSGSQSNVVADGYLEQEIWFRNNATNTMYGGKNAQCGVALDADVGQWQQPSYVTLNGVPLTESKSNLDADDQLGIAGLVNGSAEYFYPFPPGLAPSDVNQILRYRIQTAAGINTATDLLWTFECQGETIDSRNPILVRRGYFANDAGRNETSMLNQVVRITVD